MFLNPTVSDVHSSIGQSASQFLSFSINCDSLIIYDRSQLFQLGANCKDSLELPGRPCCARLISRRKVYKGLSYDYSINENRGYYVKKAMGTI